MRHVEVPVELRNQAEFTAGDDSIKKRFCSGILFLVHMSLGLNSLGSILCCTACFVIVLCCWQVVDCILQVSFNAIPSGVGIGNILREDISKFFSCLDIRDLLEDLVCLEMEPCSQELKLGFQDCQSTAAGAAVNFIARPGVGSAGTLEVLNHGVQFFGENRWDGLTAGLLAQGNGPPERLQAGATCYAFGDVGFDFPSLGLIHLPVDVFR